MLLQEQAGLDAIVVLVAADDQRRVAPSVIASGMV
jgi:hypothetical protein